MQPKNDQQNAVACSIALSFDDPHEVPSIPSCVDLNSQSVFPSIVSQKKSLVGIPINNNGSFSSIICSNKYGFLGCKLFHTTILNVECSITTYESRLASHHAVLHFFFFIHHPYSSRILYSSRSSGYFLKISNFSQFPNFCNISQFSFFCCVSPRGRWLGHVALPTDSFKSLLLRSPASSSRCQSKTSLM